MKSRIRGQIRLLEHWATVPHNSRNHCELFCNALVHMWTLTLLPSVNTKSSPTHPTHPLSDPGSPVYLEKDPLSREAYVAQQEDSSDSCSRGERIGRCLRNHCCCCNAVSQVLHGKHIPLFWIQTRLCLFWVPNDTVSSPHLYQPPHSLSWQSCSQPTHSMSEPNQDPAPYGSDDSPLSCPESIYGERQFSTPPMGPDPQNMKGLLLTVSVCVGGVVGGHTFSASTSKLLPRYLSHYYRNQVWL